MRFIYLLGVITLFFIACSKDKNSCKYDYAFYIKDTSLFISFTIDSTEHMYFQSETIFESGSEFRFSENMKLFSRIVNIYFSDFIEPNREPSGFYSSMSRNIELSFWYYGIIDTSESSLSYSTSDFIIDLNDYVVGTTKESIEDTTFMKGIDFAYNEAYPSRDIVSFYNYNLDSINDFFSNSFFKVTSIEPVCRGYYLVKGNFATKIITNYNPFETKKVENGHFSFLIH